MSWTDDSIVAYTTMVAAYLQLSYSLRAFGTGAPLSVTTDVATYIDVSPVVTGLSGVRVPPTVGGTVLVLTVEYITPSRLYNYTIGVTVGGAPCPVVQPGTTTVVPPDAVGPMLLRVYDEGLFAYNLSCLVPPGEGTGVPVVVTRDNSTSGPVPLAYQPPTVATVVRGRGKAGGVCGCLCEVGGGGRWLLVRRR